MSWPGIVLMLMLGVLAGAVLAFFRARVMRDVARYMLVGIFGFALGQGLSWLRPLGPFEIGIVNVAYGILGVAVVAFISARLGFTH